MIDWSVMTSLGYLKKTYSVFKDLCNKIVQKLERKLNKSVVNITRN